MTTRRGWLALGAVGLLISAGRPVAAGTSGEAEGGIHGGTSSGTWACGPSAQVKYGGLGARGRLWFSDPQPRALPDGSLLTAVPEGLSIGGGVAAEARRYSLLDCNKDPCSDDDRKIPPTGFLGAASLSAGYDAAVFGVRAGLLVAQRYKDHADTRPTPQFIPELSLRLGRFGKLRGELGLGSYSTDTLLRPGLYLGGIFPVSPGAEIAVRLGGHQVFDSSSGLRLDIAPAFRLGESARIEIGAGLSESDKRLHPHGRLALGTRF